MKILLWMLAGAYLILVLAFVEKEYEGVICRGVDVRIHDSLEYGFLSAVQVKELVRGRKDALAGQPVTALNTQQMEEALREKRAVENAQVYTTVEGSLVVEVTQRKPVIRVFDRDNRDFYLDSEGFVIPSTQGYAPRILLASGYINGRYRDMNNVLEEEENNNSTMLMENLLEIAGIIDSDPFWSSQIVQVYVDGKGEFELIPRVGSHLIVFGSGEKARTKFFKLRTLYSEGFSREGWNQYEIINLKYDKQVICTKR